MPGAVSRVLRSSANITVLFSALVLTPLLALSHFNAGLAGLLGGFADSYLPNSTLINAEKKSRASAESRLREQRIAQSRERSLQRRTAMAGNRVAGDKGKRVLVRGAGALMVGWVPVVGVAADVFSLGEDYRDICELFAVIDRMSDMLFLPGANLYQDNYCHMPEEGMARIRETARTTEFSWQEQQ